MKKIFLLFFVALFASCGSAPKTEQTNQEESTIHKDYWNTSLGEEYLLYMREWAEEDPLHKFRGFEWGTRLDVVLEKEGEPDDQYFFTDNIDYNKRIDTYHLVYENTSVAGYEMLMEISFYNDALFSAHYNANISQGSPGGAYRDIYDKLTILYGEPDETKNDRFSYTAYWRNIKLYCSDYNDSGALRGRAYVVLEYIDSHKRKRIYDDWENEVRLMQMRANQRKDTSGL